MFGSFQSAHPRLPCWWPSGDSAYKTICQMEKILHRIKWHGPFQGRCHSQEPALFFRPTRYEVVSDSDILGSSHLSLFNSHIKYCMSWRLAPSATTIRYRGISRYQIPDKVACYRPNYLTHILQDVQTKCVHETEKCQSLTSIRQIFDTRHKDSKVFIVRITVSGRTQISNDPQVIYHKEQHVEEC